MTRFMPSTPLFSGLMVGACALWLMIAAMNSRGLSAFSRLSRLRHHQGWNGGHALDIGSLPVVGDVLTASLKRYVENVRLRLRRSGDKNPNPCVFITVKFLLPLIAAGSNAVTGTRILGTAWWVYPLVIVGLHFAPDIWLNAKIKQRQELILHELPEFVDILAVCADSGLNITECLRTAVPMLDGPLRDVMDPVLTLMSAGRSPVDALRSVLDVCDTPEMVSFVSCVAQSEEFGTPISQTLYDQSKVTRQILRRSMEARINVIPTKMAICVVVFLFPPIFVLLVLPSVLTFIGRGW